MSFTPTTRVLFVDADEEPRAASAHELAELGAGYMLGSAVGQLRHLGVAEEEVRARFEAAIVANRRGDAS